MGRGQHCAVITNNPMDAPESRIRIMIKRVIGFLLLTGCGGAFAATFTVGTLIDNDFSDDANPGDGVCADESPLGTCTLRAAIQEANALAGSDTIEFSVAGTISPDTSDRGPMPAITGPLTIDGSTAPGWVPGGAPAIYLDGRIINASAQPFASGLVVDSGPFLTVGLGLIGFPWAGIEFQPGSLGGMIQGCWFGLDANGDAQPNPGSLSSRGVLLEGDGAIIGLTGTPGNFSGLGNVIGGHALDGITIQGDNNTILGNVIGMTADGMSARGNEGWGIYLSDTADGNRIGDGDGTDNAGNAIANNALGGIVVDGTNNVVDANTIGFRPGTGVFFRSQPPAIEVGGDGHVIGGAAGNRIIDRNSGLNPIIRLGRTLAGGDVPATNVLVTGNQIRNNGGPGIGIRDSLPAAGVTVFGNSIRFNGGIGIDFLEWDGSGFVPGPTPNDPGDPDGGANRKMNYPEFGEAVPIPGTDPLETMVTYRVDADPANQAYPIVVDFYRGERSNGYGRRDGAQLFATDTYETAGALKTLTLTLPGGVGPDWHFTALATDADGNTSEFAPARSLGEVLFRDGYED